MGDAGRDLQGSGLVCMPRSQGLCGNAVARYLVCSNALNSQRAHAMRRSFGGWLAELTHRGAGPSRTMACVGLYSTAAEAPRTEKTSEGSRWHSDCRRSLFTAK